MRRFTDLLSRPLNRLQRRFERSRPGSILIFVIALLVLLALMGTAYIATARQDRFAAAAGNSGDDINRELANALQAALDDATKSVTQDVSPVTGATPGYDPTIAPSLYVAARAPYLDSHPNDTTGTLQPTWASISRVKGRKYEAIYVDPTSPANQPQIQYDFTGVDTDPPMLTSGSAPTTNRGAWHIIPTNIVITYNKSNAGTSPSLDGRTYVYPAFFRWRYGKDPTAVPAPSPVSNIVTEGPFLAGDATGDGIADSAFFKLSTTRAATYYAAIRIVDNASGINLNTAWDKGQDLDVNGNCYNFFPTDVDLRGMLYMAGGTTMNADAEMQGINTVRLRNGWNGTAPGAGALPPPERGEGNASRTDIKWRNAADAMWMQYGRRLNHPQRTQWGDRTAAKTYARAFDTPDQPYAETAGVVYRGVMANQDTARSYFEQQVLRYIDVNNANLALPSSFDRSAMNFTTSTTNRFTSVPANNVGYWYDWNFNYDNIRVAAAARVTFPLAANTTAATNMGTRVDGGAFRTPRGMLVASNPVRNFPVMLSMSSPKFPNTVYGTGAINLDTMPYWANSPHKTSLNTAGFGELWRAYWNVIAEPPAQLNLSEMFHVPGVDTTTNPATGPDSAINMFSNPLRDPQHANSDPSTGRGKGSAATARLRLDAYNTVLLRSALAAVNTMNHRDSSNMQGTNKVGLVRQKTINIHALDASSTIVPVKIHVYGNEPQPFITEVFANTNIDKSQEPTTMGKNNPKGYVAVQLYNPYPVAIDLSQYTLWYVDRKSSAAYPNLTYKPITLTTALPASLAPNAYLTLENFDPANAGAGNGTTDATYRPPYITGDQTAHTPDMVTVKELYKVLEDPADPTMGGELVIMRPSDNSATPPAAIKDVVPVDSYDFTGLKLMLDPNGNPKPDPVVNVATKWHYYRLSGNTTTSSWKCVYPGRYDATKVGTPRHEGTKTETWNAQGTEPVAKVPAADFHYFPTGSNMNACYTNDFPGIRLNSDMFSRSTKFGANGATSMFPFGGFARVGDVEMIPFIGAYTIEPTGGTTPTTGFLAAEANSISIDSSFADDGDPVDDKFENIGRFCPLKDTAVTPSPGAVDDYLPYGAYVGETNPLKPPTNATQPKYAYHWAIDVLDNFTTIANPQDDYLPNIAPTAVLDPRGWPGTAPDAVPNGPTARNTTPAAATINNGKEDLKPVEGLININTAPWQVLAQIEWYPKKALLPTLTTSPASVTFANTTDFNRQVAQWIVRYRDVDGGTTDTNGDPVPHGAFTSLMELNGVFQGAMPDKGVTSVDKTKTFMNAFGKLDPAAMPDSTWGNYAVDSGVGTFPSLASQLGPDFANQTLMVTRVSNLLTTRSDSFTVYVVVQGWRNVGTAFPELIAQRRAAIVLDRSGSIPGGSNSSVQSYSVPSK